MAKFPIDDPVLKHAEVADVSLRASCSYESVHYFVTRFPTLLNDVEADNIELEFAHYQCDQLPITITENERADNAWHAISKIKDLNGRPMYMALAKVMLASLTIPHSNAASVRIFSILRKKLYRIPAKLEPYFN